MKFLLTILSMALCIDGWSNDKAIDSLWMEFDHHNKVTFNHIEALKALNGLETIYKSNIDLPDHEANLNYILVFKAFQQQHLTQKSAMFKTIKEVEHMRDNSPDSLKTFYEKDVQQNLEYLWATYFYKVGNYEQSEYHFENLYPIDNNRFWFDKITPLNNIGVIMQRLGDHEKAISYFIKSMEGYEPPPNIKSLRLANIGLSFIELSKTEEALGVFLEAYEDSKIYEIAPDQLIYITDNLHFLYAQKGQSSKAQLFYEESKGFLSELETPELINHYLLSGKAAQVSGEMDNALHFLSLAKETAASHFLSTHSKHAQLLLEIGHVYLAMENYEAALQSYQEGLQVIVPDFQPKNIEENPTSVKSGSRYLLYELQLAKARAFELGSEYSEALKAFDLAFTILERSLRYYTQTDEATYRITRNAKEAYEEAIETALEIGENEKAFFYSQKAHNFLLIQSIQLERAKKGAGVPDSLLQKEASIKFQLGELQNRSQIGEDVLEQIINTQFEYDSFLKEVKKEYPIYELLEPNKDVRTKEIQRKLGRDKTYLEFFVGKNNIYTFLINKTGLEVKQQPSILNLKQEVINMRSGIYDYWLADVKTDEKLMSLNKTYSKSASDLYERLIKPVENEIKENLIVVPDGVLNFIPFEALLTKPSFSDRANQNYMIKDHQISYNYSAPMFMELQKKRSTKAQKAFLSFAPSFLGDGVTKTKNLGKLNFNIEEAEQASLLFEGTVVKNNKASKANFLKAAKEYKIIHLSTHGKSNDAMGDFSFIAFAEDDSLAVKEQRLYVREIYDLDLNADLVVLSACETGIGELKEGEGIISLSRAFASAGAKSTITSLWSVNDAQTSKLMIWFYENIKKGMSKDEALRQAKLTYLEKENIKAPFFWAGFIPSGNMEPIIDENNSFPWPFVGLGILVLSLTFFGLRKRIAA